MLSAVAGPGPGGNRGVSVDQWSSLRYFLGRLLLLPLQPLLFRFEQRKGPHVGHDEVVEEALAFRVDHAAWMTGGHGSSSHPAGRAAAGHRPTSSALPAVGRSGLMSAAGENWTAFRRSTRRPALEWIHAATDPRLGPGESRIPSRRQLSTFAPTNGVSPAEPIPAAGPGAHGRRAAVRTVGQRIGSTWEAPCSSRDHTRANHPADHGARVTR